VREIDVRGLEQELTNDLTGDVRFDTKSIAVYANDSSNQASTCTPTSALRVSRRSRRPAGRCVALLWGHCHQRATGGVDAEEQVLERMGLQTESVQGGCCGLAGSWGSEHDKWEISLACGEQA
jgi:hypothetical protein